MEKPVTFFSSTPFGDAVTWMAGVIVADGDQGNLVAFGSGFLASPSLALTARHVIDEMCWHFTVSSGRAVEVTQLRDEMPFGAQLATADKSGKLVKWDITDFHFTPSLDIIALSIEPAESSEGRWPGVLPIFEVLPPTEGSSVTAFGYPLTKVKEQVDDGSYRVILSPKTSKGHVDKVYFERRDSSMLHFPCCQTDARMDHGMSGGPVFNSEGQICGVVCSSLGDGESGRHISYASLFYPALGISFNPGRLQYQQKPRLVLDEADEGRMRVKNRNWISVNNKSDKSCTLRFQHP